MMMREKRSIAVLAAGLLASSLLAVVSPAQAASKHGCFRVSAAELNIRERPYADAKVVGTAVKGDVLEKRKLFCTPRGYWCAIRTGDGIEGYADKGFMDKIPCP